MNVLERAELEISNGNLWRAKEILQGSVGHSGYKVEIYEKLGVVLLEMRDLAEAGKYLFLSGVKKIDYEEAIGIFLQKYQGKPHDLFRTFPRSAKLSKISEYPKVVADELRELGLPETLKDENGNTVIHPDYNNNGRFELIACFSIAFVFVALIILGIVKLLEIIF
jgi:hypothetical protein